MGKVNIINDKNEVIGEIDESEVRRNKEIITRAVAIFVFNSAGELLLQKRSKNKWRHPHHWTCSASGFVSQNESYIQAALHELKEELHITKKPEELTFLFKKYVAHDIKHIFKVYKLTAGEVKDIKNKEVDQIAYFSIPEIKEMIQKGEKFSPFFISLFDEMIKKQN